MDEESDVDLLIIKDTRLPFHRRGSEVRALLRPLRPSLPMDIIVLTPGELDAQLRGGNIFLETISGRERCYLSGVESRHPNDWLEKACRDLRRLNHLVPSHREVSDASPL